MSDRLAQQGCHGDEPRLKVVAPEVVEHEAAAARQLELRMLDIVGNEAPGWNAKEAEIRARDVRLIFCCCPEGQHRHDGQCKLLPSLPGTVNCVRPA